MGLYYKIGLMALLINTKAMAADGLWFATKLEVGYDEYFIATKVDLGQEGLEKLCISPGIKFKLSDTSKIEPSYGLQVDRFNNWQTQSFFKIKLEMKL